MDTALCNALLKICIDYFQKVYEDALMQENQGYYHHFLRTISV